MTVIDNPFAKKGGLPSISFARKDEVTNGFVHLPVGTKYVGVITKLPEKVHSVKYGTSSKLYWHPQVKGEKVTEAVDSVTGKPNKECWSYVVAMKVDGEEKALWVPEYSQMFAAVGDAIEQAKVPALEVGGTFTIELVGYKQGENPNNAAAKQYACTYSPPNIFEKAAEAAPAATPTEVATTQGPPAKPAGPAPKADLPPAKPAGPVLVDGYTKAQWIEAGYDDSDFAGNPAKFGPFLAPAAPAGPPAKAAAPIDIEAQRAAAMAKLSPEDRALLYPNG